MKIQEIAELTTTLAIDPDEARVLAAACTIAFLHCEGSEPTINPLEEFGDTALMGMYLESLAAMFEAASMAGAAHFALSKPWDAELSLSAIRKHGTNARFPLRTESEAGDAI